MNLQDHDDAVKWTLTSRDDAMDQFLFYFIEPLMTLVLLMMIDSSSDTHASAGRSEGKKKTKGGAFAHPN